MSNNSNNATQNDNPRTKRSQERLALAIELVKSELESGEWISSKLIHERLGDRIADGMFGRAKKALAIEHRRIKAGDKVQYEWRLPKPTKSRRAKRTK